MIVSIMQPAFLPWLGYFNRYQQSDIHIALDHVQMDMSSKTRFANRNKIRTPQGWSWITVPIEKKGLHQQLYLDRTRVNNQTTWGSKAWRAIEGSYRKAPYFEHYAAPLQTLLLREWTLLNDLNIALTGVMLDALCIRKRTLFSSQLGVNSKGSDLILDLCRMVGAKTYISGPFGRDYLQLECFHQADIRVVFHDYSHPEYKQNFDGFEPYMSALDVLLNHGPYAPEIISNKQCLPQTSGSAL
jgi:hypothetical protein